MPVQHQCAIYTRVSTGEQNVRLQERELLAYAATRRWVVSRIYRDVGKSGGDHNRPALQDLLADCRNRKKKITVVLVWKFDRFARSLSFLLQTLQLFRSLQIDFVSATEAIDSTLPHGELLFQIFGAIAQ